MIQQINKYNKLTALALLTVFHSSMVVPAYASLLKGNRPVHPLPSYASVIKRSYDKPANEIASETLRNEEGLKPLTPAIVRTAGAKAGLVHGPSKVDIGGPSQPEMSAFKSVGTDNMVNLFTGDFSYNIPLLDVGGYPVNIFYDGGIGMEQEASWVGLGWNINPGNVNRNMRGIPDDFDGTEKLVQEQNMKPNQTVGMVIGGDLEIVGLKALGILLDIDLSFGASVNNYLGPAIDAGLKGNVGFKLASKGGSEKGSGLRLGASLGLNASSRSGVNYSASASLTATAFRKYKDEDAGLTTRLGTSFNSRTGIKALDISGQFALTKSEIKVLTDSRSKFIGIKDEGQTLNGSLASTSISFNKPSYIPRMRMPLTNTALSGRFQYGIALWAVEVDIEAEIYGQVSRIASGDRSQSKPMIGYFNLQKAKNNADAVMDFTRLNDNEITPETPVISAPQYAYDIFSIHGEGTGGSIRAYRSDDGYVRDNYTRSSDNNNSLGIDLGTVGQIGVNFSTIRTPSTIGDWVEGNKLRTAKNFGFRDAQNSWENVYFRNPGETSVLHEDQYKKIGNGSLVRFALGGSRSAPTVEPVLEKFAKTGEKTGDIKLADDANNTYTQRAKRTQVISFLNAEEASKIGLETKIRSYDRTNIVDNDKKMIYDEMPRFSEDGYRKKNHISQINVLESGGQRYVYGLPVYNLEQKDFSFTVASNTESSTNRVAFTADEAGTSSPHTAISASKDGYVQVTHTPPYAHSFLLTGLLSPDYVDVTNNGITEDDLGTAVKFNYSRSKNGSSWANSKWRTPLVNGYEANFNEGKRTEKKDDMGLISYGERESWYLHSIESKTMIALFRVEDRHDAKGAKEELRMIDDNDNSAKRLKQIDLYSKADIKKNGLANAKPIKSVHFTYNYSLCKGTPDNPTANEGKLTLEKIYFTYNGVQRTNKSQYVFSYGTTEAENPDHALGASDRWGNYKPSSLNPASAAYSGNLKNSDYPYSAQTNYPSSTATDDVNKKTAIDKNASAWMLRKILLPSGGQMEISYESDDYAFVQNKRAAVMLSVIGFAANSTPAPTALKSELYTNNGLSITDNNYAFIKVPVACSTKQDVYKYYLSGIEQLLFKLAVKMPKGVEYLQSYAFIDGDNYGVYGGDGTNKTIWVKMKEVDNISPLSVTAIEFLREQLPGQAFEGYDVSESVGIAAVADVFGGFIEGLRSSFKNPVRYLRENGKAKQVEITNCFVRVNDADGFKYGGGHRVKSIRLKDSWKRMNQSQLYTSEYGQEYDYTTKEVVNGLERTISSGVASYEPSLGGEENPWQTMYQVINRVPLGPTSYGSIEMPVLDAFFPSAMVGYSKVTVRSVKKGTPDPSKKARSGIGKQVTEFYTAKDFPVYFSNTNFDNTSDLERHRNGGFLFFKTALDTRALSQGFLVETNDMHGKLKSQASYPENDEKTPINYTQNFYRNTGVNGFDEKFDFVYADQGGKIYPGNMGIDVELMNDLRQFRVRSQSLELQIQIDLFPVVLPVWLPFIWPVTATSDNVYRAATATKVVTYHSVLDSVVVIDKGSQVSTKNILYDAETGEVIVSRTNNEFNKSLYNTNYPAWWGHSGMGLAYKNIDAVYKNKDFNNGVISGLSASAFESGDELYIIHPGTAPSSGCAAQLVSSENITRLWAINKHKNYTCLTDPSPDIIFIDENGKAYTRNGVTFKIVRSGHRNMLAGKAETVLSMNSPILKPKFGNPTPKLVIDENTKVINATAVEYKEKWQTDNSNILRTKRVYASDNCSYTDEIDCDGIMEQAINPYLKGLLGNFRSHRSMIFYHTRKETDPSASTSISKDGELSNFKLYWDFNTSNNLVPDVASTKWVWKDRIMRVNSKGLELETKNALDIYTGAQYGYNKTTPVAIANNSRNAEMFYDGFEDNLYNETINAVQFNNCNTKQLNILDAAHASIIDAGTESITAHTGKYVMKVNAGATASVENTIMTTLPTDVDDDDVSSKPGENYYFPLIYQQDAIKELVDVGGKSEGVGTPVPSPLGSTLPVFVFSGNNLAMTGGYTPPSQTLYSNGVTSRVTHWHKTTQYVKVTTPGTYSFTLKTNQVWDDLGNNPTVQTDRTDIKVSIFTLNGQLLWTKSIYSLNGSYAEQTFNDAVLGCDTFVVVSEVGANLVFEADFTLLHNYSAHWSYTTSLNYQTYKSLYPASPCYFNKPIAAEQRTVNPSFSVSGGKKMLAGAWAREYCGSPCYTQSYTHSKIQLVFNDGSASTFDFEPSGPIIEGWQRIEKEFTVPAGATIMTVKFINSDNSHPVYFDDIRLHPFSANMKSYVYDPVNLRLVSELDDNNYASFYEYDEEGTLIRVKVETKEGIKTLKETRSAKQKNITTIEN